MVQYRSTVVIICLKLSDGHFMLQSFRGSQASYCFIPSVTKHLSVSQHVRDVIGKCRQTIYALKVLRSHSLNVAALKDIYRSIVAGQAALEIYHSL